MSMADGLPLRAVSAAAIGSTGSRTGPPPAVRCFGEVAERAIQPRSGRASALATIRPIRSPFAVRRQRAPSCERPPCLPSKVPSLGRPRLMRRSWSSFETRALTREHGGGNRSLPGEVADGGERGPSASICVVATGTNGRHRPLRRLRRGFRARRRSGLPARPAHGGPAKAETANRRHMGRISDSPAH